MSLRHALAVLILCGSVGCRGEKSPYCPQNMLPVPERSVQGKSIWCETRDKARSQWIEWLEGTTKPRQSCGFRDGKPEGSFTAWHRDGKQWVQGQFSSGQKTGKWKQWDSSGNKVAEGDYISGRLVAGAPVAAMADCERVVSRR